ncbi:auxilin-related protein 2-like [Medicago truncatula]|uniref:auxilin-related protein 2-like n=1 Tax=Medicago truncatula TaxID=3880 RepID=UPI00196701F6|nr:auxilin-related protein 2-like [Medicago truncatula]
MEVTIESTKEEPSLVGRIKTRRNLICLTHAQVAESVRMGWAVLEREKSSYNSFMYYSVSGGNGSEKDDKAGSDFDDLLAGFGRHAPNIGLSSEPTISASKTTSTAAEDPLKVYESTSAPMDSSTSNFTDPFEEISKFNGSRSTKNNSSSTSNGIIYEDTDSFDGLGRSVPALSSQRNSSKGFRF